MAALISQVRKVAALIWLVLPPILLSAIFHMADPDINGWQGLASYSALWSVALFGALVCPFVCLCLGVLLDYGWSAFLAVTGVFSSCFGLTLTIVGTGASTVAGHMRSLAGCTGIAGLIVLLAVIPAVAMGWPWALFGRRSETRV